MEDNRTANVASACCEMAVAKLLARYWSGHVWPVDEHERWRHLPDVEPHYEVRRVRRVQNGVAVRRGDVSAGRVIVGVFGLRETGFRFLDVLGGLKAQAAWDLGEFPEWDKGRRQSKVVAVEHLVPVPDRFRPGSASR